MDSWSCSIIALHWIPLANCGMCLCNTYFYDLIFKANTHQAKFFLSLLTNVYHSNVTLRYRASKKRFAREEKDSNIATSKIFSFTSYQPTCTSGFSYVCVLRSHKHKNRLHLVWVVQVTDFIWMKCVLSSSQFVQIIRFWCILDRAFQLHPDSWFNFWCHDPFLVHWSVW